MPLASGDCLFSSLPICRPLIFFLLFVLTRISRTMLSKCSERGHPCHFPGFRGNALNFSLFRIMLALDLSYMAFMILR